MALSWNEIKDWALNFPMVFLFERYEKYSAGLFTKEKPKKPPKVEKQAE